MFQNGMCELGMFSMAKGVCDTLRGWWIEGFVSGRSGQGHILLANLSHALVSSYLSLWLTIEGSFQGLNRPSFLLAELDRPSSSLTRHYRTYRYQ